MCIAAWGADYGITKTSAIYSSSAGQLLCSTGRFCGDAISRVHLEKSAVCLVYFDSCLDCTGLCSGRASKLEQGAEPGAVVRKELSLSGIQRPLYPGELGEDAVEVFRFGDFAGWIIEG